ncbi:MAG: hypothetical protein PVJ25_07540 [Desulfuromonadales bacterium]|jgi:hypothetical protein
MVSKADFISMPLLAFCCIILAACMTATTPTETTLLLEQDYLGMSDSQLVDYEQRLSDELVNLSRTGSSDVGIGFSFGSWGSSSGYGVRTDQRLGGGGDNSTRRELKSRRDDVRSEMRRRGLLPE